MEQVNAYREKSGLGATAPTNVMTDKALPNRFQEAPRLRAAVLARRGELTDRSERSQRVWDRLVQLPSFARAQNVAFYVSVRSEVETQAVLASRLQVGAPTAVPFCQGNELQLCWLRNMAELAEGHFGVLEPLPAVRDSTRQRRPDLSEMDAILVPGVVFDHQGGRWGYGRGYYDRLLVKAPAAVVKIGVAFECQMVDRLVLKRHDVRVDYVVTEDRIYARAV